MPFRSVKQRKFMFANRPGIARRWADEYGTGIKRKRKTNSRRGFLSKVAEGYRGQ